MTGAPERDGDHPVRRDLPRCFHEAVGGRTDVAALDVDGPVIDLVAAACQRDDVDGVDAVVAFRRLRDRSRRGANG